MNLLALETSTSHLSVALWRDGLVVERAADVPNAGSEFLLPWVIEILGDADLALGAINGIAFGAGPGGFTGLRLACGVAQGLAFGLDIPLLGVSTLEALALAARRSSCRNEPIFPCLDARMGEVYCAAYVVGDDDCETIQMPSVMTPALVRLPMLPDSTRWVVCGDALLTYPGLFDADQVVVRQGFWPTAAAVARLAAPRLARGEGVSAAMAAPLYVRDKVALTTVERIARGGLK